MRLRRTTTRVALAACLALLAPACVRMPDEGPVAEVQPEARPSGTPGIYYDPQPPQPGESPTEIVLNFLDAMKATPTRTGVARQFLTAEAQKRWTPEGGIITYGALGDPVGEVEVGLPLAGIETYDARGAWRGSESTDVVRFRLSSEDGEWRIDGLPDAMIVPATWFDDWYRRVSLYFFDPTGQILVPEPVFVPDGDQIASWLVRGLLNPPSAGPQVSRSYFPPGLRSPAVPISADGVAEMPLTGDPGEVDDETATRIQTQLVWTLRQEPRIRAVRITVDEEDLLPGGEIRVAQDVGASFDPVGAESSDALYGLLDGRLVRGSLGAMQPTNGPMGTQRLGVRSIGLTLGGDRVAAVSGDGTAVLVAPVDDEQGSAVEVLSGATNLLPPAWDFADRMWLLDRTPDGARVSMMRGNRPPRAVRVPGVTGRDIRHLLVSRDGSRLVVVVRTPDGDRVLASRVRHDDRGRLLRVSRAVELAFVPKAQVPTIRDIAWRTPSAISVLTDLSDDLSLVESISVDGAPGDPGILGPTRVAGGAAVLVSSPVPDSEVLAIKGVAASDLSAPEVTLPTLPRELSALTYVG